MCLSEESIQNFIRAFDINDINYSIWERICFRLEQKISDESIKKYAKSHQEFQFNRYNGKCRYEHIIQYLSEQCQGNDHAQKVVHVTPSSEYSDEFNQVEDIVIENDDKDFGTEYLPRSLILFDFKERKVSLDSYTLKTFKGSKRLNS